MRSILTPHLMLSLPRTYVRLQLLQLLPQARQPRLTHRHITLDGCQPLSCLRNSTTLRRNSSIRRLQLLLACLQLRLHA